MFFIVKTDDKYYAPNSIEIILENDIKLNRLKVGNFVKYFFHGKVQEGMIVQSTGTQVHI